MDIIYDIETFPNCFLLTAVCTDVPAICWQFEISDRTNDSVTICRWVAEMNHAGDRLVGFNNVGFDYPVLHTLLLAGRATAGMLYSKAMAIIGSQDANRWTHMVYPSDRRIQQIDLYLIHHFDNVARATSLKQLEFNMGMGDIQGLPFEPGSTLTPSQMDDLRRYNLFDVDATRLFYDHTLEQIKFREDLYTVHGQGQDWLNFNDTKIGKKHFQIELEKAGVQCHVYDGERKIPKQTIRAPIVLRDAVLGTIRFESPELTRVRDFLSEQKIYHTKGLFDDLTAVVNGFEFVFGLGGVHGSVSNRKFVADKSYTIIDIDVTSYYPMLAIVNRFYPEHLGETFCDIYQRLFDERRKHKKGTPQNAILKLALNGVYGDSNNAYSIFYDPLYTMRVTLNGQFLLCMLAEQVMKLGTLIQVNTDGMTIRLRRTNVSKLQTVMKTWEKFTGLTLEQTEFSRMWAADVNNYLAEGVDGVVKRKGRYQYKQTWNQDFSALVVPKVAEKVLLQGGSIRAYVENWANRMDFMIRVKVNRSSRLVDGEGREYQRLTRYYAAKGGVSLFKMMPPLPGKGDKWRRFAVEAGHTVCVCNNLHDAVLPVDYEYYIHEVEKLVMVMT